MWQTQIELLNLIHDSILSTDPSRHPHEYTWKVIAYVDSMTMYMKGKIACYCNLGGMRDGLSEIGARVSLRNHNGALDAAITHIQGKIYEIGVELGEIQIQ